MEIAYHQSKDEVLQKSKETLSKKNKERDWSNAVYTVESGFTLIVNELVDKF